jgi:hypothetical protein
MGRGILKGLLRGFEEEAGKQPDKRLSSNGQKYRIMDALKSGLAVFYFQHPSLLNFQQEMRRKQKRSNLEMLFGVSDIPCTEQMKNIVDELDPAGLAPIFERSLAVAKEQGIIEQYRVADEGVLIALDGVWYFSSETIHCAHCLTQAKSKKDGTTVTTYYHDMLAATMVRPDSHVVLPLMPEFIRNEDGTEKQDCERNAAKRWLRGHEEALKRLRPTFLGDDLYANYPLCKQILDMGMSFIFTCKEDSHPWISEQVAYGEPETRERREWNGRHHLEYRYAWVNGVEIRAEGDTFAVNYLSMEIWNEEKQERTYKNAWITDKTITRENVKELVEWGRARWKIENEHHNVLKHRGYTLEHNFGHGKNHASEVFCLLNLLSLLFHGIQDLADEDYRKARASFGRRDAFFWALRYEMSRYLHDDWHHFLMTIAGEEPDG